MHYALYMHYVWTLLQCSLVLRMLAGKLILKIAGLSVSLSRETHESSSDRMGMVLLPSQLRLRLISGSHDCIPLLTP